MRTRLALLLGFAIARGADVPRKQPYTTWSDYGGAADSMQCSALKQINTRDPGRLELAWSYLVPDHRGSFPAEGPARHRRGNQNNRSRRGVQKCALLFS